MDPPPTGHPGVSMKFIRLPEPTKHENEESVADYISESIALYDGRELGPRRRRDGDEGLRVDFTYDEIEPPVALEITSLPVPGIRALNAELLKLENELNALAVAETLGQWTLAVFGGASVQNLRKPLTELLLSQKTREDATATFNAEAAPEDMTEDDLRWLGEALNHGLASASRWDADSGVSIFPPVSDRVPDDRGFATLLRSAMAANVDKLRDARPRETHLAVWPNRSVSGEPWRTPPPRLLDGIDSLWVDLGYYNSKHTYRLWRTTAADPRWQLLRHPTGEPPTFYPPALMAED